MSKKSRMVSLFSLGVLTSGLALVAFDSDWNRVVVLTCVFYAVIVSLFLAAQVLGFVASHTYYSESIEDPKFKMLEEEEAEWANR